MQTMTSLEEMAEIQDARCWWFYSLDMKNWRHCARFRAWCNRFRAWCCGIIRWSGTKVLLAKLYLKTKSIITGWADELSDEEHITWLKNYLKTIHMPSLISHDTNLRMMSSTLFYIRIFKMTRYTATYEKFIELAEINKRQHIDA